MLRMKSLTRATAFVFLFTFCVASLFARTTMRITTTSPLPAAKVGSAYSVTFVSTDRLQR